jgi:C1A family cysteine protease
MAQLPPAADLRSDFGPVRDQGRRPTCLAFAMSAVHEHARTHPNALSVEVLFKASKARDGLPLTAGTTMPAIAASIQSDGQCDEVAWPYEAAVASDPTAPLYHAIADVLAPADLLLALREHIGDGRAAVLVLQLTDSWYTLGADGRILAPAAGDRLQGNHAVVAVGYNDAERLVIVRNSWGAGWGAGGYALLPYDFVTAYGLEVATLEPQLTPSASCSAAVHSP